MTRRRRYLLLAMVAVAVVLAVGSWLLSPRTAITPENAAKIKKGMTLVDVKSILGGSERDESTGPLAAADPVFDDDGRADVWLFQAQTMVGSMEPGVFIRGRPSCWTSNHAIVRVHFDTQDEVVSCHVLSVRPDEGISHMIRRWLGL
jgi:hypothetical protein